MLQPAPMRTSLAILLGWLLVVSARAEFRTWTRSDGLTADLDLVSVTDAGGEKSADFKLRNGRSMTLKVASFSQADVVLLDSWHPPAPAAPAGVFDAILAGNLVKLHGKSLRTCKDFVKPVKYYVFYYTASWCGPCHRFTPALVDFYNKNKPGTGDFEVVLITCDQVEKAMEEYAAEMAMPWPQLKLSKTDKFKKEFKHPGNGIPNLVLTDVQGNVLKTSYEGDHYLGPQVVMTYLESLLHK